MVLNKDLHRDIFVAILREIYSDTLLRTLLGFKGGTAAMLFYGLPRFSVDLDFDLLDPDKKGLVFNRLKEIMPKGERGLKVEISKRVIKTVYTPKNYLGISMLVMKEEDMAAGKLAALLTRKRFATRDMFDLWFFLKENWQIDEEFLKEKSGFSLKEALEKAQPVVKNVKQTELLAGLGEFLDNKQKAWVKSKLKDELLFRLRLYLSNITGKH